MLQTLICQHGGHTWEREPSRGRKPKCCPAHDPRNASTLEAIDLTDANVETLICAHDGHEWHRTRSRGKKPTLCPLHHYHPQESDTMVKVASSSPYQSLSRHPLVLRILEMELNRPLAVTNALDPVRSLQEKLTYTVGQLETSGDWRTKADWDSLLYTHKRLIKEAARMLHAQSGDIDLTSLDIAV